MRRLLGRCSLVARSIVAQNVKMCNRMCNENAGNPCGGVGEWLKPTVLKTVGPQKGLVGSNPTPSASQSRNFSPFPVLLPRVKHLAPISWNSLNVLALSPAAVRESPKLIGTFSQTNREMHFVATPSGDGRRSGRWVLQSRRILLLAMRS